MAKSQNEMIEELEHLAVDEIGLEESKGKTDDKFITIQQEYIDISNEYRALKDKEKQLKKQIHVMC